MTNFKEYSRSTAFSISLSGAQIDILLLARSNNTDGIIENTHHLTTLGALTRKGLIKERSFELTEEGYVMCSLLVMAGFKS